MTAVSVIVPNYNHSAFLKQRIDSILNQSYQHFELIILDDCSTDNSKEIIEQYRSHPKVSQIVFNTVNSGSPFLQWEKGIQLAQGEYIWIAESDDWCEPSLLEELLTGIQKDKNCVLSYCQMYYINGDNNIKWQSSHRCLSEIVESKKFIEEYLAVKVSIYNASMAIFKKEVFNNIPRDYTTYKFSGDRLFWIQVARQGKTHICGKVLNYFRKHQGDVSNKAYKSGLNFIEELKIVNWMYEEKLIGDAIYDQAFKKQYKEFWKVKDNIDPVYKKQVVSMFKHPLSPKTSVLKFLPSAIWSLFKIRMK